MKIGDLASRTGLSTHTIRYYERIGLLPEARKDAAGRRQYDDTDIVWIAFLGRLKAAGMPIREMLRYAALREAGPDTEAARRDLLLRHRERVAAQIAELQSCLLVLDKKIAGYASALSGKAKDDDADITQLRKPLRKRIARAGGD